jgi:hypothetical protein
MRPWVLGFWCALVLCGSSSGLAQQQQTGPRTLEGLLKSDEAQKPVVAAAEAAATDAGPRRPAGTVARPKNGVQHPDLDAAWADYDKQIEAVANAVEDAIETELNSAAATGDLDASLKWKTAGEQFQKDGRIPDGLDGQNRAGKVKPGPAKPKNSYQSRITDAQKHLAAAYESLEKSLVQSHDFDKAKRIRTEKEGLSLHDFEKAITAREKSKRLSDPIIGRWTWSVDGKIVDEQHLLPDGSIRSKSSSSARGSWSAAGTPNKTYRFHWDGGRFVDTLELSEDGLSLTGSNQFGNNIRGKRIAESD